MRFRKLGSALLGAAVAVMAIAVAASAQNSEGYYDVPDPQTANVPFMGWNGSQIRLVKCFGAGVNETGDAAAALASDNLDIHSITTRGQFVVEDWSGVDENNAGPRFLNPADGDVAPTLERFGHRGDEYSRLCYSVHITSQKPGMAVVKLAVRPDLLGLFPGMQVLAKHQFLVIFLRSQAPVIHEVASTEQGGYGVGDPTGNGVFQPPYVGGLSGVYGLVKINVKGTFPLLNDFAGIDADNSVTLPDDWAWLASKFAIDKSTNQPGAASSRWDIHDDNVAGHALGSYHQRYEAGAADHNVNSFCVASENEVTDAVDNCLGAGGYYADDVLASDADAAFWADLGPFSNIYGGHPAIGPFDHLRPFSSLFSDGKLDAGDAPMPALQVDVNLGANSIGSLEKADKDDVYVADPTLPDSYPHNLYAPFYKAYIPAVGITGDQDPHEGLWFSRYYEGRSGVAGSYANNFPGFIGDFLRHGIYDYWSIYSYASRDGYNACKDPSGRPYPKPHGNSGVSVYTDEHGEAFVKFEPYTGLYLTPDANNRCDLSPGKYGDATITATSAYPDQPVLWDQASKVSNTLTKTANHLAKKTLSCIPKGTNEGFCVETIVDFNGDPISGAEVKFNKEPLGGSLNADSIKLGAYDTRGQTVVADDNFDQYVILRTNSLGQAGVIVTYSQDVCLNITAENLYTKWTAQQDGVKRFFDFNAKTGVACGTNTGGTVPPPAGGGGSAGGGGGSTGGGGGSTSGGGGGSQSVVVSLGGPVIQAQPALQASTTPIVVRQSAAKLFSLTVLQTKLGRYLVVNVKGKAKTAKIQIVLLGKNGKALKRITRVVPTNKAFKIGNLKLPKAAVSARASVLSS